MTGLKTVLTISCAAILLSGCEKKPEAKPAQSSPSGQSQVSERSSVVRGEIPATEADKAEWEKFNNQAKADADKAIADLLPKLEAAVKDGKLDEARDLLSEIDRHADYLSDEVKKKLDAMRPAIEKAGEVLPEIPVMPKP